MPEAKGRPTFPVRKARVGALLAIGLLLLAYAVYKVGSVFDVFASRYELHALVPSALGLREGAPVTLAGQRVGQVQSIDFIPVEQRRPDANLNVTLAVNERVRDQIRRDSRAFFRMQGLLGDKYVDIAPGTAGAAILQPGDTLAVGESVDIELFMERAALAIDEAQLIVADLREVTAGLAAGDGTIGQLLTDEVLYRRMVTATAQLENTLAQLNRADGTFGRMLRDPTLYDNLNRAVLRVDSLGAMIVTGEGSLARLLRDDSLYNSLAAMAQNADSAVLALSGMVRRMSEGDGSLEKLITDPQLYDEFLRAVIELQTLIIGIRQNPDAFKPNIRVDVF
ncbi:MAG: MCE family protein [Candidatus Cloacimonetes bacterium]|jgi:phospholipid/cholesterol/gamma-HCH transport system substrate-binding protein|nr:MCE family protein [Candidatus Cloacimonadota bacterium]